MKKKNNVLTVSAILIIFINLISMGYYFLNSSYDVISHMFNYGFYEWGDSLRVLAVMLICQMLTTVIAFFFLRILKEDSLVSLWLQRRTLEEKQKIEQLKIK